MRFCLSAMYYTVNQIIMEIVGVGQKNVIFVLIHKVLE